MADRSTVVASTSETKWIGRGKPYETPYYVFGGKDPGPVVLVQGCIHGNEIAGTLAMDRMIPKIEVESGTLIVLPRMNIIACNADKRFINVDLNRVFRERNLTQFYEHALARAIYKLVGKNKVEYLLTTHESRTLHDAAARKGLGQTICYGVQPPPPYLDHWVHQLNRRARYISERFHPIYYPIATSSTEVLVEAYGLKGGFCLETWSGFALERRIRLQWDAIATFMTAVGLGYKLSGGPRLALE